MMKNMEKYKILYAMQKTKCMEDGQTDRVNTWG